MGNQFINRVFSQKIIKKIEMLAFEQQNKIIKTYVPDKIKSYLNSIFSKEINYFQKNIHLI